MTLNEFERWFKHFKENADLRVFLIEERTIAGGGDRDFNLVYEVLNKVKPSEDRDFLLLKYSEYL